LGSPVKEPSPRPSTEPLEREMPHPQSPYIQLSKSPVDEFRQMLFEGYITSYMECTK